MFFLLMLLLLLLLIPETYLQNWVSDRCNIVFFNIVFIVDAYVVVIVAVDPRSPPLLPLWLGHNWFINR